MPAAKRCEAINPATGERCGDYAGHSGRHTSLIASELLRATPSRPERVPVPAVDPSWSTPSCTDTAPDAAVEVWMIAEEDAALATALAEREAAREPPS